jgi:hypothetical protein
MPQPNTELVTLVDAVRAGHGDLDRTVNELRFVCQTIRSGQVPDTRVGELLERFSEELLLHFAEEELEETFGSLLTDQPRLLHRVDRLQKEHGDMSDAVGMLMEVARSEAVGIELVGRLERLLDWLAVHEHAENTLMQELVLLDEGDGG